MSDPIDTICNLVGCPREDAEQAYAETQDVVEAVDKLLVKVSSPAAKYLYSRRAEPHRTEAQQQIEKLRTIMEQIDKNITKSTSSGQHGYEGSVETPSLHEETVLQNNCSQECQIPVLQSEAQTQETACPSKFDSNYYLPLNGQT